MTTYKIPDGFENNEAYQKYLKKSKAGKAGQEAIRKKYTPEEISEIRRKAGKSGWDEDRKKRLSEALKRK